MIIQGWVLFVDTPDPKLGWKSWIWRKLSSVDFRHVMIIQKINYGHKDYYTFLDPAMGWLGMRPILDFTDKDVVEFGNAYGYDVTHIVQFQIEPDNELTLRGLYSCVGVVKQLLGIKDYKVWTPKALHNLLTTKYNFKEIPICSVDQAQLQ